MTDRPEASRRPPGTPHGEEDATCAQVERSVERLFGEIVDADAHATAERGEWPARLWTAVVDAGYCTAPARVAHAGIEASWADAWPILRGIGYWQVPLPLAETMIGAMLLSKAGVEPPPGAITLVGQGPDTRLAVGGPAERPTLAGQADRVPWARHCRWALVSTPEPDALCLVELAQPGSVRVTAETNLAGEPCDQVTFSDARVALRIDDPLPGLEEPVRHLGALARSAAIAGALESVLEQSVRYANERIQFGRPIAAFQAIQHSLAILAAETVAARTSALVAAASAPSIAAGDASRAGFDIAVAKLRCSEAATRGAPIAHQVHGAIGFTREHPLHRATCRLWAWRAEHGSDAQWAARLGGAAIAAGSQALWPALTQRRFDAR